MTSLVIIRCGMTCPMCITGSVLSSPTTRQAPPPVTHAYLPHTLHTKVGTHSGDQLAGEDEDDVPGDEGDHDHSRDEDVLYVEGDHAGEEDVNGDDGDQASASPDQVSVISEQVTEGSYPDQSKPAKEKEGSAKYINLKYQTENLIDKSDQIFRRSLANSDKLFERDEAAWEILNETRDQSAQRSLSKDILISSSDNDDTADAIEDITIDDGELDPDKQIQEESSNNQTKVNNGKESRTESESFRSLVITMSPRPLNKLIPPPRLLNIAWCPRQSSFHRTTQTLFLTSLP